MAVGALFMAGCVAPVGFALWIPAAVLAAILIAVGLRAVRNVFFGFVAGVGVVLIAVGILDATYVAISFLGAFVILGAVTGYAAFGPRTSHAERPLPPPADEQ